MTLHKLQFSCPQEHSPDKERVDWYFSKSAFSDLIRNTWIADFRCWPKGAQPLGIRMVIAEIRSISHLTNIHLPGVLKKELLIVLLSYFCSQTFQTSLTWKSFDFVVFNWNLILSFLDEGSGCVRNMQDVLSKSNWFVKMFEPKVNFKHNRVVCTSYISKPSEAVLPYLGSDSDLIRATGLVFYRKIYDLKIESNKKNCTLPRSFAKLIRNFTPRAPRFQLSVARYLLGGGGGGLRYQKVWKYLHV